MYEAGRRVGGRSAVVHVSAREDPRLPSRLGLAVGRGCGPAVRRNRIKRRLRAAFDSAGVGPGMDVVVGARGEAALVSFQELVEVMRRAVGTRRRKPAA